MRTIRKQDTVALDDPHDARLREYLAGQNISLKPNELEQVRSLLGRNPTPVELHIFNIMWSEHCSYKSSKGLLRSLLPTQAPHVVLGPGEDAGIVRFHEKDGKTYCLVLAHESHNHPSQVLPVEGAATGIGGIVRDVYCMGAEVIGCLDPLRFGDPGGPNAGRVRDIVRGVVEGIAQYGNALGVPNYGGDTYFDASFDDNCLVNVVAVGVVAEEDIIRSRAPAAAGKTPHDIVLIGKPTDASGFGGAAFASERLSGDEAEEKQEAVQIPDPFLKRVLAEATRVVLAEAKGGGVDIGFKDLGAGGISCAVSEMAQAAGVGAVLDLGAVSKSSVNLADEVIACSETQERYAMIVPRDFTRRVCEIYNDEFELPHLYTGAGAYVIGHTTTEKRFKLESGDNLVCDAGVDVITTGIEYERQKKARPPSPHTRPSTPATDPPLDEALVGLLSSANVADKSILFRHYDSEVRGRAVLRPGEADAAVAVFLPGETLGVATAVGGNSSLGRLDPYLGGVWAVLEAARNVACAAGMPLAVTDCLNYGDPEDPHVFWEFAEGVRGVSDACRGLHLSGDPSDVLPVVSGNVSFYNQSGEGEPIAPTPIVACAGRVDDVSKSRGMAFREAGSRIVLLGELHDRLGGSEYARLFATGYVLEPPRPDLKMENGILRALLDGFGEEVILSAHDISHGGLLVTLSEMVMKSAPFDLGCRIDFGGGFGGDSPAGAFLFSEYGGVVVEVDADKWPVFQDVLARNEAKWLDLGATTEDGRLRVILPGQTIDLSVGQLDDAYRVHGECNRLFV
ncbi:MAG: phosphoribosylformylglycinamidine synthase subunit PurL [Candidatus Krumholzibacteriia bacterium]